MKILTASLALPVIVLGTLLTLSACAGRDEPGGSILDPVCMPTGGVVWRQVPNQDGTYGDTQAKKEYCPWYKKS